MRDLVFVAVVVGFFAVATLFVRACAAVIAPSAGAEEERQQ